jgi:hypothetical protein
MRWHTQGSSPAPNVEMLGIHAREGDPRTYRQPPEAGTLAGIPSADLTVGAPGG